MCGSKAESDSSTLNADFCRGCEVRPQDAPGCAGSLVVVLPGLASRTPVGPQSTHELLGSSALKVFAPRTARSHFADGLCLRARLTHDALKLLCVDLIHVTSLAKRWICPVVKTTRRTATDGRSTRWVNSAAARAFLVPSGDATKLSCRRVAPPSRPAIHRGSWPFTNSRECRMRIRLVSAARVKPNFGQSPSVEEPFHKGGYFSGLGIGRKLVSSAWRVGRDPPPC